MMEPHIIMDLTIARLGLEPLPLICVAVSTILFLYLGYYAWQQNGNPQPLPNHAFTASTRVGRRGPTVLQFSA